MPCHRADHLCAALRPPPALHSQHVPHTDPRVSRIPTHVPVGAMHAQPPRCSLLALSSRSLTRRRSARALTLQAANLFHPGHFAYCRAKANTSRLICSLRPSPALPAPDETSSTVLLPHPSCAILLTSTARLIPQGNPSYRKQPRFPRSDTLAGQHPVTLSTAGKIPSRPVRPLLRNVAAADPTTRQAPARLA